VAVAEQVSGQRDVVVDAAPGVDAAEDEVVAAGALHDLSAGVLLGFRSTDQLQLVGLVIFILLDDVVVVDEVAERASQQMNADDCSVCDKSDN
jgi:hypothetical protein